MSRPRQFDPDQAVATAQRLFHTRGYDAVSVEDVTDALDINPPSFYVAFGSKAGLYARVLDRYANKGAVPLSELLRPDRPVAECLAAVLEEAARRYSSDPDTAGCLVLEGTRCKDQEARMAARAAHAESPVHSPTEGGNTMKQQMGVLVMAALLGPWGCTTAWAQDGTLVVVQDGRRPSGPLPELAAPGPVRRTG
jgi:AcrR family transcriptional regulator